MHSHTQPHTATHTVTHTVTQSHSHTKDTNTHTFQHGILVSDASVVNKDSDSLARPVSVHGREHGSDGCV